MAVTFSLSFLFNFSFLQMALCSAQNSPPSPSSSSFFCESHPQKSASRTANLCVWVQKLVLGMYLGTRPSREDAMTNRCRGREKSPCSCSAFCRSASATLSLSTKGPFCLNWDLSTTRTRYYIVLLLLV